MEGQTLSFTLEEMQTTLENAKNQEQKFSSALETIDSEIKNLSEQGKLVTGEVGIYEALVEKYNEKRQSLFDARDLMIQFCNKLDEKISDFNDAATAVKNSFN